MRTNGPRALRLRPGGAAFFAAAWILVASALAAPQQNSNPIRIAILSEAPSAAQAVDLLTVDLSQKQGVQLLERAEIEKVYREQALSARNTDYLKLGQLLGADGLLFLGVSGDQSGERLDARLLAVKPAVIIHSVRSPWPVDDVEHWVSGLVTQIDPFLSKLAVKAGDAVPLSIANMRSALHSDAAQETERQATLLAIERLSREPELFVLERQRMELLSAEKELKGLDETGFWNGSYVLEGVLDRDSYSKDFLTLNARLAPPKGGTPIDIEVRGSRTNLSMVIDQLATKIREALKLQASSPPWKSVEEADRYFDEAKWAYRWGIYPQGAAASETAWALGRQTKEVAELRIRCYSQGGVDTAVGWFDLERKLVTFTSGIRPIPGQLPKITPPSYGSGVPPDAARFALIRRAMELYCEDFRSFVDGVPNPGWGWHDLGLDVLENASNWLRHFYYTTEARAGHEETIASVRALAREMAGLIGHHSAFTNDFGREQFATQKVNWGQPPLHPVLKDHDTLAGVKLVWGNYWAATPEECLGIYRELVESGSVAKVRRLFLQQDFVETTVSWDKGVGGTLNNSMPLCYLAGWKWEDRRRAPEVWHRFIDSLCVSTNDEVRLEGLFIRCAQARSDGEHQQALSDLAALLEQCRQTLARSGVMDNWIADVDALVQWRGGPEPKPLEARSALWNRSRQKLAQTKTDRAHEGKIDEMKQYLAGGAFDFMKFAPLFLEFNYQEDDARILLPALSQYRTNLAATAAELGRQITQVQQEKSAHSTQRVMQLQKEQFEILRGSPAWLDRLEQTLKSKLTQGAANPVAAAAQSTPGPSISSQGPVSSPAISTAAAANQPIHPPILAPRAPGSWPVRTPGGLPERGLPYRPSTTFTNGGPLQTEALAGRPPIRPWGPQPLGTNPESLNLTNGLILSRFCRLPDRLSGSNEPVVLRIVASCFREGRLWLDTRFDHLGTFAGVQTYYNRGAIFSVDLDSFHIEPIPLDPHLFSLSGQELRGQAPRAFEVFKGWLYVSSAEAVKRYSLKAKTWENVPVPVPGHGRFSLVNDRLFLSTENSILELSADGKETHVLASTRRQPPATILDSLLGYDGAPLLRGPQGEPEALIAGTLYEMTSDGKDWKPLAQVGQPGSTACAAFDDGLILTSPRTVREREMLALFNGASSPELLLVQPGYAGPVPVRGLPARQKSAPLQPRFPLPEGVYALDYPVCLEGHSLWVFAGHLASSGNPVRFTGPPRPIEARAVLFRLLPKVQAPFSVGVQFKAPGAVANRGLQPFEQVFLQPTPRGLVVASSWIPGFWLIPQNDLDQRLKAWQADRARPDPRASARSDSDDGQVERRSSRSP